MRQAHPLVTRFRLRYSDRLLETEAYEEDIEGTPNRAPEVRQGTSAEVNRPGELSFDDHVAAPVHSQADALVVAGGVEARGPDVRPRRRKHRAEGIPGPGRRQQRTAAEVRRVEHGSPYHDIIVPSVDGDAQRVVATI